MDLMVFWNFIAEFDRAYTIHRKRIMQRYDLSAIEVDVLLFIANNPTLNTASDIVYYRKIAKSHVSLAVKSLLKKGYIDKYYDENNRKRIHLAIQPAAEEIISYGREEQRNFGAVLEQGISEDEKKQFKQHMSELSQKLRDAYN